ncbi:MAG: hypothetical protein Q9Q40_10195 [Acidobacteriota bacterium]|nr:hypothetical protein [Acidobacteriota bacterium]
MRLVRDLLASLARLSSRPSAVLSLASLLVLLALVATVGVDAAIAPQLGAAPRAVWTPAGVDRPFLEDLPWYHPSWRRQTGAAWGALGLLAILVFTFGDAVLLRAAVGPWKGLREAWGEAARRGWALLVVTVTSLAWVALVALAAHRLIGEKIADYVAHVPGEIHAMAAALLPDLLWLSLAAPVIVAADQARALLVIENRRSGLLALWRGLRGVLSSPRPMAASLLTLALESVALGALVLLRDVWDPRLAAGPAIASAAILAAALIRILARGCYLGALGRASTRAPAADRRS